MPDAAERDERRTDRREHERRDQRDAARQLAGRKHAAAARPLRRRLVRAVGLVVEVVVRVVRHQLERGHRALAEHVASPVDRVPV